MSNRPNFAGRKRAGARVAMVPASMWLLPARRRIALVTLCAHADAAGRSSVPARQVLRPFWQSGGYPPTWPSNAGPPPQDFGDSLDDCITALVQAQEVELVTDSDGLDAGYRIVRLGEWEDVIREQMGRGGWAELRGGGWGWPGDPN